MTSKKQIPKKSVPARPGEGFEIPVSYESNQPGSGGMPQVDLASAPVPPRCFSCSVIGFRKYPGSIVLLLGQKQVLDDRLRALVIIRMPIEGLKCLKNSLSLIGPVLHAALEEGKLSPTVGGDIVEEPSGTVEMVANLFVVAIHQSDAVVDFYYASPVSMFAVTQSAPFCVVPVVRAQLSTGLLAGLVQLIDSD